MAVLGQSATGHPYTLTVGGVNCTRHVPADTVHWSEVGGEGNAQLTFTIQAANGILPWSTAIGSQQWLFHLTAPEVYLTDTTNSRNLFGGNLVNVQRRPMPGPGVQLDCTAVSFDAWLDRRASLKWRSVENIGGVVRKISSDNDIVHLLIAKFAGFLTANTTYCKITNGSMPIIDFDSPTVAQQLGYIAEVAATQADPTARRFYVDFYKRVHYFKGNEASAAPYRVGNADYQRTVDTTAGLVEMWPFREVSGTTFYGIQGVSNGTLNGGITQDARRDMPNQPMMGAPTLNGSTGYVAMSGASLHPGDTFSIEVYLRRPTAGVASAIVSAGVGDYELGFTAGNALRLTKVGTGDDFVTTATYATTSWYHIVCAHSPGSTNIYVNGVDQTGTLTARVMVAAVGNINWGRRLDNTLFFSGQLQFGAVYNVKLSAATALAHYNDSQTIVPDYIDFEDDLNSAAQAVYVRGANSSGSGWVYTRANVYDQTQVIDRPHISTSAARDAAGTTYLNREGAPVRGGKFSITGFDGWRAGQTVHVKDTNIGVDADYEIRNIDGDANLGSGVTSYEISYGAMPWRGKFDLQRKPRMRQWALA